MAVCKKILAATLLACSAIVRPASAQESDSQQRQRQEFAIACAGAYEYQYSLGGFDPVLLMYKRELMGQLVYNDINSPHYRDKAYFEQQVSRAYKDLLEMPVAQREPFQFENWSNNPIFCDELTATVFILISSSEWIQGKGRILTEARRVLIDIYPWKNNKQDALLADLEMQYQHVVNRANNGSEDVTKK